MGPKWSSSPRIRWTEATQWTIQVLQPLRRTKPELFASVTEFHGKVVGIATKTDFEAIHHHGITVFLQSIHWSVCDETVYCANFQSIPKSNSSRRSRHNYVFHRQLGQFRVHVLNPYHGQKKFILDNGNWSITKRFGYLMLWFYCFTEWPNIFQSNTGNYSIGKWQSRVYSNGLLDSVEFLFVSWIHIAALGIYYGDFAF